jgi:hypothetical protein
MTFAQIAGYTTYLTQRYTIYNPVLCIMSGIRFETQLSAIW